MLFLRCPKCGLGIPYETGVGPSSLICPKCGTHLGDVAPEEAEVLPEGKPTEGEITVAQKYGALRIISGVYKFLGWATLIIGIIVGFIIVVEDRVPVAGIVTIVASIITGILLLASGELFSLFIDLEENTRRIEQTLLSKRK